MDNGITLGKCSNFLLTMLGDFCSQNGMSAKIYKDYKDENTKAAFGKYNLVDGKSELAKITHKFYKKILDLNAYSPLSNILIHFPSFLQESIKYFDFRLSYYFTEKQIITFLLVHYISFYYKNSHKVEKEFFLHFLYDHNFNTYNEILKDTKVNYATLEENCKWKTLEEILKDANTQNTYDNKEELYFDCFFLVQHYLFLGFKKALEDVFNFSKEEIEELMSYLFIKIDKIIQNQDDYLKSYTYPLYKEINRPVDNSEKIIYSLLNLDSRAIIDMFYTESEWVRKFIECGKYEKELQNPELKNNAIEYFINSYIRITKEESDKWIMDLENLDDEYYNKVMIPWYKARINIFTLTFTDAKKDKELKEEACKLFRDTFNNYKYLIGYNLEEFLSDAIICDVYCNPKKDILNNAQDNTNESSILIPGKAYWEFGYALNIFDEDSKKTYLLTYNAENNFWINFPPEKFENQENALEEYCKESENSDFMLPCLLKEFNDNKKIDNLLSPDRKSFRQLLGTRHYSTLSIRCLKAKNESIPSDFSFIKTYIKNNKENADLLFTNDENGANALIRSLWRYKMLSYGYTDEDIVERSRIFNEYYTNLNINLHNKIVKHERNMYSFEQLYECSDFDTYINKCYSDFYSQIFDFYYRVYSKIESTKHERESLKSEIKEKMILPLIRNAGNHITDEAINLDGKNCVTALQIAIDCFDDEIVKEIIDNIPEKIDLAELLISSEHVTSLSYAIRKYDYLMQFCDMLFSKSEKLFLEKREIQSRKKIGKGILSYDKDFYIDPISDFIEKCSIEECGCFVTSLPKPNKNIYFEQQQKLLEIIKLLAEKTNPISVDTLYYLADQIDPSDNRVFNDIFDIVKILIETEHADLSGTDFLYEKNPFMPSQTLLAYCINYTNKDKNGSQKNYDMLNFLLSNYPEKFKPTINRKIHGFDNDGKERFDTDLHFFITNQIESIKLWNEMDKEDHYGKEISSRMSHFLSLFVSAGARLDIPDHDGKTVKDLLIEWQDKMPEGCIPEEILRQFNN